jgi:hypothetical protein
MLNNDVFEADDLLFAETVRPVFCIIRPFVKGPDCHR